MLIENIRKGLKVIWWKPELVKEALFDDIDIPFCPTTAKTIPSDIITYEEAKRIYKREIKINPYFKCDCFVCFYMDDYKFDTFRGIWFSPKRAFTILCHFKGIITPDFSTYLDFPYPLKIWNTYRMRAFGYWCGKQGLEVINNIRGSISDYSYCFRGVQLESIVCIGTVGSGLKLIENRDQFSKWLLQMVDTLKPEIILVYGSSNYECFDEVRKLGIRIISYESKTSKDFKRSKK